MCCKRNAKKEMIEKNPCRLIEGLNKVGEIQHAIRKSNILNDPEQTHFINENTVVRIASLIEENGYKPHWSISSSLPDHEYESNVIIRTLFLFRNMILHETGGYYIPDKIKCPDNPRELFNNFCEFVPKAKINEGERLCLSVSDVIIPLIKGCIEYVNFNIED